MLVYRRVYEVRQMMLLPQMNFTIFFGVLWFSMPKCVLFQPQLSSHVKWKTHMSKTVEPINYNIYYISQCVDLFRTNGISSGYRWYALPASPQSSVFASVLWLEKKTGKPKWTRRVRFIRTCWILLNKFTICTIYSITCSNVIYHVYCIVWFNVASCIVCFSRRMSADMNLNKHECGFNELS